MTSLERYVERRFDLIKGNFKGLYGGDICEFKLYKFNVDDGDMIRSLSDRYGFNLDSCHSALPCIEIVFPYYERDGGVTVGCRGDIRIRLFFNRIEQYNLDCFVPHSWVEKYQCKDKQSEAFKMLSQVISEIDKIRDSIANFQFTLHDYMNWNKQDLKYKDHENS